MNRQEKIDLIIRMGYGNLLDIYDVDELDDVITHLIELETAYNPHEINDWQYYDAVDLNQALDELGYGEDIYVRRITGNFPLLLVSISVDQSIVTDEEHIREALTRVMQPLEVWHITMVDDVDMYFYNVEMFYPLNNSLKQLLYRL